jgi:predicted ATPase/transcriptional regulator with XRE-family HTH domain
VAKGVVAMVDDVGVDVGVGFGELLRRRRRAAGLTQEELAARAGLSARGIADLERGARRTPRRDTVTLLVRALGVGPEDEAAFFAAARGISAPSTTVTVSAPADDDPEAGSGRHRSAPSGRTPHNLPAQPTPLLGRDEAARTVVALARRVDVRLVTLTGSGGVGKTRLAIQVASDLLDGFPDGVWFVRLSRLTDPSLVIPTIAETLGLKEVGGQPIVETLRHHLRERRVLLVLDNCEHVAAAAPGVAELLEACPSLSVLATSRMALHLRGEHEYPVAPLGAPPAASRADLIRAPERLMEYPATALFVERARAVRPDFALTAANAPVVAEICARLDGLPLAIELAAVRVKLLPPPALLARLEHSLGFLVGGARDLAERQQAMRSTIAWSENLLSAGERALFRRLGVFAGGCALEAIQEVCAAPEGAEPLGIDALEGLGALVDQSLAQQREESGEPRFGMLRVIREYALERLEASGEVEALRRAHAAFALALAERAEPELTGPEAGAWLDRLEREHDNLRAALGWAWERGAVETGLRLVAAVFRFWMVRGHLREGRAWAERLLALELEETGARLAGIRARALRAGGVVALYQGDEDAAVSWLEQAVALGRASGEPRTVANALSSPGVVALGQGDPARAEARLEESLALTREVGARRDVASVLTNLGIANYMNEDMERAAAAFAEALAIGRLVGDRDLIATNLANLSSVALRQGEVAGAEALGRDALALYWELGDPRRCAVGLEGLAGAAGMAGHGARAARLLGAAAALRETLDTPQPSQEQAETAQATAAARAALGEVAWTAAFGAGQALTLEQAIAEALGVDGANG